ncbi:MAG: HEAT repeat domain-containing protein [Candidatus Eisenbacteria sp.]|nr:HEAT repeat domain-containing protein [Candidatus Eisenbacteria bacterium]
MISLAAWLATLPSPCLAQEKADPSTAVPGLDSLASATLLRALDYLELRPEELGFDKLYAEDDTFRLGVVEDLLNDPLSLPPWQEKTLTALRGCVDDPAELIGELADLCGARDDRALEPSRWPLRSLGPSGGKQVGAAPDTASTAAPYPAADTASDRAAAGVTDAVSSAADLERIFESFMRSTREAERWLEKAFAEFTPEERSMLLMIAPALWGDFDEHPDQTRKGQLHAEMGVEADTTVEITEDDVLDLAVKLDRAALTRAACLFLRGLTELAGEGIDVPLPRAARHLSGVTGTVISAAETPWGLFVLGGPEGNVYSPKALEQIAFLVEPGGDDVYRGRAASAVGGLTRSFSAVVDLAGNDFYDAPGLSYVHGGAVLGVAALIDLEGNDVYRGDDGAQGVGCFGAGFLYDGAGVDFFEGRNLSQGAGAFGIGALVSDCTHTPPAGRELQRDRAYEAGLLKVPGTGAVPIRYDDNDTYLAAQQSQGFASTFGAGLLYDRKGNDTYRSGGHYLHAPLLPHDFQSLSQGFSIGFRPRAGGGIGVLMDEEGNDFYDAEVYAQGAGYWYSLGLLFDGAGNDRYLATQYAQGAGIHLAVGSLWDVGGDDHYACKLGVTQGTAHDLSVGLLLDESGNDYYLVSDGQGISITNSVALFIDAQGDDFYATPRGGQGKVTWTRGFCGVGLFLDLEGQDTYPLTSPGANGGVWRQATYGLGIDLDRDLQLPDEAIPEIVLTPEDSARTVEELFETASIWEVGSAREKVRRARQGLIAKGIAAVDYVVAEKLGTKSGLEYRAISELAKAYPDSFAARILPLLERDDYQIQRTVIALLGDLKRSEAREPMEAMLKRKEQKQHWTRVIAALGKIGEPEAAPSIRLFLGDEAERRRISAVVALSSLGDTACVERLVDLLSDPLFTVRSAASRALSKFGASAVGLLCEGLNYGTGLPMPGARGEGQSSPRTLTQRRIWEGQNSPRTLSQARIWEEQNGLRTITLGRIAVALRDSTDERSLRARAHARRALMAELERFPETNRAGARAAAVRALVELGDPETLSFVKLHMEDEFDPLVRNTYEQVMEPK